MRLLVLSSCLFTDRMLRFSSCLESLARSSEVELWASSVRDERVRADWKASGVEIRPLPPIKPFPYTAFDSLRRLNDSAWDRRLGIPSRTSMRVHVREAQMKLRRRTIEAVSQVFNWLHMEEALERNVERIIVRPERSAEATARLRERPPRLVVTTSPFRFDEPAVVAAAKRLGIPTVAFITSWDNLSTKNRMPFRHDAFLVWSEQMRRHLHEYYPYTRDVPVFIVGAPQFDVFFEDRFQLSREEFCRREGLDPRRKIVLYALGSPNFIREHHGAIAMAQRVSRGELGDIQLLVRPHPNWAESEDLAPIRQLGPRVVVQNTGRSNVDTNMRTQDAAEIENWVSTFRNVDVVVNLSSTVAIDAAICDKPVVNLDYDPEPGQPNGQLVKDINRTWIHFAPIARSGGMWLTGDLDETVAAVRSYLADPSRHAAERRWMAEYVCGFLDGNVGERMAEAIRTFAMSPP